MGRSYRLVFEGTELNRIALALMLVLVCGGLATPARAALIYDNTVTPEPGGGSFSVSGDMFLWYDDAHLMSAGDMTEFSFRYIANGATEATFSFYTNDATNSFWPGMGSELIHTEVVALSGASGLQTVPLATPVPLPQDIWMSIQFDGGSGAVPLYTPAAVGSSDPNEVVVLGSKGPFAGMGTSSFPFRIATADAPEPMTVLLLVPGMLLLGLAGRRAR